LQLFRLIVILIVFLPGIVKSDIVPIGKIISSQAINGKKVFQLQNDTCFIPSQVDVPNLGKHEGDIWIKVPVHMRGNTNENKFLFIETPLIENLEIYELIDNKLIDRKLIGSNVPIEKRLMRQSFPIYELHPANGKQHIIFLKINTKKQLQLPLYIVNEEELQEILLRNNLIFFLYAGIILAMFFYNLFLWFTVKDSIYLYYVVYILVVGLIQSTIDGYSYLYFWPDWPAFADHSFYLFTIFVNITGLIFTMKFLQTRKRVAHWHNVSVAILIVYFIYLILLLIGFKSILYQLLQFSALTVAFFMLFMGIRVLKKGYRPALFFLIAWSFLIIGIIIYAFTDLGFIRYTMFTHKSLEIGSALEVILLSFALADKINLLKKEKEYNQKKAYDLLAEREKLISEQNDVLERTVALRTDELKSSNLQLSKAIIDLQNTQAQLVNAEKMSSLGQLTAGIAHEINNPINFVGANIKPLRRDIGDLYEIIDSFHSDLSKGNDTTLALKMLEKRIREFDYHYIKEEVDTLLKGMEEGATRTIEIVKGLKNFSRLDEAESKFANINEGLESTLILLNSSMRGKVNLELDLGFIPEIECYPGKLNQVFMNLLNNAIYACLNNINQIETPEIRISTKLIENQIEIKISDNGMGIPKEKLDRIYDPFFTTKPVGEGTGLGLSIVFSIIELHKGEISVTSEVNKGTTFKITLPYKAGTA
jgi:signal transduction histidine kinase